MIDVKLINGDVEIDSAGRFVKIFDSDTLFQRALICIAVKFGSFIYDRSLGSQLNKISLEDDNAIEKAELIINEALAEFEDTYARVIECSEKIKVEITIGNESRIEEVYLNGNV